MSHIIFNVGEISWICKFRKETFMKNKEKKGKETTNISIDMYGTKLSGIYNQI